MICSCKSSGCTEYQRLSLVQCLSVCFQGFEFESEDYPCILCLYREPEELLLPIYASYKCFFALKGAWGIKKGGSTSLNSLLHTPLQEMMESSRGRRSCLVFRQRNAAGIDNGPSTSAGLHAPQRDIHQVPCPPTKTQRHQHPHHTGQLINT